MQPMERGLEMRKRVSVQSRKKWIDELEKADNANTWLDYFVKYQDIEELSRTVV